MPNVLQRTDSRAARLTRDPDRARRLAFFRTFLNHPRQVGAVLPSGKHLAAAITHGLSSKLHPDRTVIELGPGTGAFTAALLKKLPNHAAYLGIELDPGFVRSLRRHFPAKTHPNATFTHGSAEHAHQHHADANLPPAGLVVCGLPFASLPTQVRQGIVQSVDQLLEHGGAFRTFQYVHASRMKAAKRFRDQMDERFGKGRRSHAVVGNVPPAYVLEWQRPPASR